jgi:tetratricopeptide (TPR) repeat protein
MACAEKHFRKTLELDPSLDIARLQLGMALESQGKLTQAAKQYELYLANEGQDPKALARMGGLLRKMGNNNDAIYYYEQALEKQAQNPHLHNALGELFLDLSQYHKAAQHFKTALQIKPDYPKASQNLKKVEELRD